jgi:hypothetical protein
MKPPAHLDITHLTARAAGAPGRRAARFSASRRLASRAAYALCLVAACWVCADCAAQEQVEAPHATNPDTGLRGWIDITRGLPRAYVCGAVAVGGGWSAESCGSGAGTFSEAQGVEVAHLRMRWRYKLLDQGDATSVDLLPSVGVMEVQRGQDSAGLRIESDGVEASGVEAAVSLRWLARTDGAWWRVQVDAGAGWVPDVSAVVSPTTSAWIPFSLINLGFGF